MFETQYTSVGEALCPYQEKLIERLWQATDACYNLEFALPDQLQNLINTLVNAYFTFLQNWQQNTPDHLGEILNQNNASPMFLSVVNKSLREFCFTHLDEALLVTGLEATADFFLFLMQSYIQTNQGMVVTRILSQQERERLRAQLTDHELAALKNLAKGMTNKQIAGTMGVTERTVVNYLRQARQIMGTKRRSDTMIAAIRLIEE
jgi:DNA-binding CsgD family transcriptional regulator